MNLKELHFNILNKESFNYLIKHNFKAAYKDRNTLIEQLPVTSTPIEQTPLTKIF